MDDDVLETKYLLQPRGPGTAYLFRMKTPSALVGKENPRTGRPYGCEIKESIGGPRRLPEARKVRDIRLAEIHLEEHEVNRSKPGSLDEAYRFAEARREADSGIIVSEHEVQLASGETDTETHTELDLIDERIVEQAMDLRDRYGLARADEYYDAALGQATPLNHIRDRFLADWGQGKSQSTLNNFKTVYNEFLEFAGPGITLQATNRRLVAGFVTEYLPNKASPKAPSGQSPTTVQKKVTLIKQVWRWAMDRGVLEYAAFTPWDRQAPKGKQAERTVKRRRPLEPAEAQRLFGEAPKGTPLGDIMRVALLTGVRLEEVASLTAEQLDGDCNGYEILEGKSENAARYVPLVGDAYEVIAARRERIGSSGPLFPELAVRESTGKRGGAISQRFTRLRRKVLGDNTDNELVQHSFRHTWRTAARRAGVDDKTAKEMGGWSRGNDTDLPYDHAEEKEHYRVNQLKIAEWLVEQGFFGAASDGNPNGSA